MRFYREIVGLEEARVLPVILSVIRARRAPVEEEITVTVVDRLTHTGSIVEYLVTYNTGSNVEYIVTYI